MRVVINCRSMTVIITVYHNLEYHCYQLQTKLYPKFFSQGKLHKQTKLLGIINVNFDVIDPVLIRYSALVKYYRKNVSTMGQYEDGCLLGCSTV
jgi:hypothetical protein